MARIKINELSPAGSELFQDPESFLDELKDGELIDVRGGSLDDARCKQFLNLLQRLTAVSDVRVTDKSIQTAISNSINKNTIISINFPTKKTINGRTLNGFSVSNVNTAP